MKQVRFIPIEACGLQVREAGEGQQESRRVVGKPIVFGVRSVNLTPWSSTRVVYEVLEPGCISDDLLQRSDVLLNLNHSHEVQHILGRYRKGTGTLTLAKREGYIESECDLPNTTAANDTLVLIKRGDITGMSFAFQDDWEDTENGVSYERTNETIDGKEVWVRHVKRITGLYDVSIVTTPAYDQTTVGTRDAGDSIDKAIEEQLKRECGGKSDEEDKRGCGDNNDDDQKREDTSDDADDKNDDTDDQKREDTSEDADDKNDDTSDDADDKDDDTDNEERERAAVQHRMRQRALLVNEEIESLIY